MEGVVIVLVLILIALVSISSKIGQLVQVIANKRDPQQQHVDLSGLEKTLEKIYKTMGGEEKMKTKTEKDRKELKERYIKILVNVLGETAKQAQEHADKIYEEAEFEEKYEDYDGKFINLERAVKQYEAEERNKAKYGHLLNKARQYVEGKSKIGKYDSDMVEKLQIDYTGEQWLIKQLVAEGKLKEITEWDAEDETSKVKGWEVVNN